LHFSLSILLYSFILFIHSFVVGQCLALVRLIRAVPNPFKHFLRWCGICMLIPPSSCFTVLGTAVAVPSGCTFLSCLY
jgi:hypothetical protein